MMRITGQIVTKAALAALAGLLLAAPSGAQTAQMDADDDPKVAGPLELRTDDCRRQHESFQGQTVASGKTCLRIYTYDPGAEADTARNYGIAWLQSNLNSSRGWCGAVVQSDIDLPEDITVESKAPKNLDLARRRTYKTAIATDALGSGGEDGTVEQEQILYPRKVRTRVIEDSNVFRLRWAGLRDDKLGFASGAEISWAADQAPGGIQYRLNYEIKRGDC